MAFARVTDIATLIARQTGIDAAWLQDYDAAKAVHSDIDFDDLLPSIIDPRSRGERCGHGDCVSPLVSVESISAGDLIRVCRHCINVIKQASLIHRNPAVVCYRCKTKRNPDGIVAGAIHVTMDIEDSVYSGHPSYADGDPRPGLKSIIAGGKVFLDDATNEVRVRD